MFEIESFILISYIYGLWYVGFGASLICISEHLIYHIPILLSKVFNDYATVSVPCFDGLHNEMPLS